MNTRIAIAILVSAIIASTAALAAVSMSQTAEAKTNDCSNRHNTLCDAGGVGGSDDSSSGGGGRRIEFSTDTLTFSISGGSGANQDNGLVGGGGGKSGGCDVSTQVCDTQVGGSGRHQK